MSDVQRAGAAAAAGTAAAANPAAAPADGTAVGALPRLLRLAGQKWAVVAANVAVALVLAAVVSLQLMADRAEVVDLAYRDAENLSGVLAEHTRQTLAGIDLALASASESLSRVDAVDRPDPEQVHRMLARLQQVSPATFAFFVLDRNGRLAASSRARDVDPVDLSGFPEFTVHRDAAAAGTYLGRPRKGLVGHAHGRWIVDMTRPVSTPDGRFAGVGGAAVSIDRLLEFHSTIKAGRHGVVGLLSGDGVVLVRSPWVEDYIGRNVSESAVFASRMRDSARGRFLATFSTDGVRRFGAFDRVDAGRALVYVGMGADEVLATWRRRAAVQAVIAALAMAMFAAASRIAWAHLARVRALEAERSRRLRTLAEVSTELVRATEVDAVLARVSEAARSLIGAHQVVTTLTRDGSFAQSLHAVVLSEKYQQWRDYDEDPDGSGIYRLVCESNRPMLLTQQALEAHPAWRGFGAAASRHPPMRGWLAVPIVGHDGSNLGLIQLSDKVQGDFDEGDLNKLQQLAGLAGTAIENLRALESRDRALAQAVAAKAEVETVFASISDAVFVLDHDWRFSYLNAEAERLLERQGTELLGRVIWETRPEDGYRVLRAECEAAVAEGAPRSFEFHDASLGRWLSVRAYPHARGLTVYFLDVSRRVDMEERLRQAQKMEAVGQLTGGIAHDFNNLLTVILGNADALLESPGSLPSATREQAESIRLAGERAAALTHRLLAFARRQPLDPKAVDVNALVAETETLLRRAIGESIDIEQVRGSGLWRASVDPSELQNAILNLAINARDAMPTGGKLTIETARVSVDQDYADQNQMAPGQYVMVAVSDTGTGMPPAVRERAFEPFFTTKASGRGTGLGLSQVYGFARQSGGTVRIYTEPGQGTTVRIYLPRAAPGAPAEPEAPEPQVSAPSGKRVLLVEDDALVRAHAAACLVRLGYEVQGFETGVRALARIDAGAVFDLLLTDVVLPGGMSGRQVAEEAVRRLPGLKVLYMSGYTENAIVHHGRLEPGVQLLTKPFRIADLARKIDQVLHGG